MYKWPGARLRDPSRPALLTHLRKAWVRTL
jgi:hypothetical protein